MSLRALDQEFEELSYACSVNMDKLFQNSLATSKLESRYSQIKPAVVFNDPTE